MRSTLDTHSRDLPFKPKSPAQPTAITETVKTGNTDRKPRNTKPVTNNREKEVSKQENKRKRITNNTSKMHTLPQKNTDPEQPEANQTPSKEDNNKSTDHDPSDTDIIHTVYTKKWWDKKNKETMKHTLTRTDEKLTHRTRIAHRTE